MKLVRFESEGEVQAEAFAATTPFLHASVAVAVDATPAPATEVTLRCRCASDPVEVVVSAPIARHACRGCGVHMRGTVADPDHHFYGLTFIHPELALEPAAGRPEFAGFVSSLIERGTPASMTAAVRGVLARAGIAPYDAFSPEIMDVIAYHRVKLAVSRSAERESHA